MTAREKGQAAANVFGEWFRSEHLRVRYAAAHRGLLRKKIEQGGKADGYRAAWLAKTARELVAVLNQAKADFDVQHPWDILLPSDMGDAMATAAAFLRSDGDEVVVAMAVAVPKED